MCSETNCSQFDKNTGHMVKLRNGVMHPVRSIVRRHEDVQKLIEVYMDLFELMDAIHRLLTAPRQPGCPSAG